MLDLDAFAAAAQPFELQAGRHPGDEVANTIVLSKDGIDLLLVKQLEPGVVRFIPQVGDQLGQSLMPTDQENLPLHAACCARDLAAAL